MLIDTSTAQSESESSSSSSSSSSNKEESEKRGRILCGCETIRKRALVRSPDGQVKDVVAYGVCSVFCREEFRGKGYAGRMMEELGKKLSSLGSSSPSTTSAGGHLSVVGTQRPLFSVLFSDIGKQFYASKGWKPFPSTHITLPPGYTDDPPFPPLTSQSQDNNANSDLPTPTLLSPSDLPPLCSLDEKALRSRLSNLPPSTTTHTIVSLIPDHATIAWHHARENFLSKNFLHLNAEPEIKGALVTINLPSSMQKEGKEVRIWCYFLRNFTTNTPQDPNTLFILRWGSDDEKVAGLLQAPGSFAGKNLSTKTTSADAADADESSENDDDDAIVLALQSLLLTARFQAYEWGMREIKIWSPSGIIVEAVGKVMERAERSEAERSEDTGRSEGGEAARESEGDGKTASDEGKAVEEEEEQEILEKLKRVEVITRERESIGCLRWFGDAPSEERNVHADVEWWGNEKFGWC
jgi:GNAT superfamily N-acetyltransferase